MEPITQMWQISDLICSGFTDWKQLGMVDTKTNGELTIFNYNQLAVQGKWNFFELVSRGLILNNKTGECVARPFDKFFNYGELGKTSTAPIKHIYEKMDGSLGILYRDNGNYHISTRGSFDSPQALWATDWLNNHHYLEYLPEEYTLLFEIIYPGNRIVINYGKLEGLILLNVRNRFTGEYLTKEEVDSISKKYRFQRPFIYEYNSIDEIISTLPNLDGNDEGFVVEFEDGQRFKFKGKRYLEIHKLLSGLSMKNTIPLVYNNLVEETLQIIPDEFLEEFKDWVCNINFKVNMMEIESKLAYEKCPKSSQKEFAEYVQRHFEKFKHVLFAMHKGKDIKPVIYKTLFGERYDL